MEAWKLRSVDCCKLGDALVGLGQGLAARRSLGSLGDWDVVCRVLVCGLLVLREWLPCGCCDHCGRCGGDCVAVAVVVVAVAFCFSMDFLLPGVLNAQ